MPKNKSRKRRPKKRRVHTEDRGEFVWETYFVGGEQKHRKQWVTTIDGEIIEDMDAFLLANADDVFLHQMEPWDLIEQRRLEEEPQPDREMTKPEPRRLSLNIGDLEMAFDMLEMADPDFMDSPCHAYLNLTTGEIAWPETEDEAEEFWADENLLELPRDFNDSHSGYAAMEDFVASLDDGPLASNWPARSKARDRLAGSGTSFWAEMWR